MYQTCSGSESPVMIAVFPLMGTANKGSLIYNGRRRREGREYDDEANKAENQT